MILETKTAQIYNDMADEYDDIKDLWYGWLFSRLHYLIVRFLLRRSLKPLLRCLDVGCGTGFQTILLALCGYEVKGIDISSELIRKAHLKDTRKYLSRDLFESPYSFVNRYSTQIRSLAHELRNGMPIKDPWYEVASATNLPYENESFDLVNCCGSTLSSIENYKSALKEMTRVLRSGGIILLEVENKYNLDLIWPILDSCLGGIIGYDQELKISLSNLFGNPKSHVKTDFPFSTHSGEVLMPIWLFSSRTFQHELEKLGLEICEIHAIHNFTNLIPSVALDRADPPSWLIATFKLLSKFETITSSHFMFRRLGCSLVLFGNKH